MKNFLSLSKCFSIVSMLTMLTSCNEVKVSLIHKLKDVPDNTPVEILNAPTSNFVGFQHYGLPTALGAGYAITTDSDNNIIMTGAVDKGFAPYTVVGGNDIYVAKFND